MYTYVYFNQWGYKGDLLVNAIKCCHPYWIENSNHAVQHWVSVAPQQLLNSPVLEEFGIGALDKQICQFMIK